LHVQQPGEHLSGVGGEGRGELLDWRVDCARGHGARAGRAHLSPRVRSALAPATPRMRVLRRYLSRQIIGGIVLVVTALIMLFSFFDLIYELRDVGSESYRLPAALAYVALSVPGHLYELLPVATLIGTLFVLAQLVVHSEYAVMRTSGVSIMNMASTL